MIGTIAGKISEAIELLPLTANSLNKYVGMEAHMEKMNYLLSMESNDKVRMIGIWGMEGIGKTAIATCLYGQIWREFTAHCFIKKVQEVYLGGPSKLKEKFLSSILSGEEGFRDIKARLGNKKALVVLDGVDERDQVHTLAKETNWLGQGSRIIITTRDKGLLNACGVHIVHEVKCLNDTDSLRVFEKLVYEGRNTRPAGVKHFFSEASQLAHGLPSALKAYALFFSGLETPEWQDALHLLKKLPHQNVQKILRNSYDSLDDQHQIAFLHVACLLNGYPFRHATSLLVDGSTRLNELVRKSFFSISTDGCIDMHALVVQIGREFVRIESMGTPSRQRFMWDSDKINDVLHNDPRGTHKIEGMTLHMCEKPNLLPRTMGNSVFKSMYNLKFLKFFQHLSDTEAKFQLNSASLDFPYTLRLLHWDACPLKIWPTSLRLDHLVEINLRYSNLKSLWENTMNLQNLLRLDVTGSRNLVRLPDLSSAKNLEELTIEGCRELKQIPESIMILNNLKKLNAIQCDTLRYSGISFKYIGSRKIGIGHLEFPNMRTSLEIYTDLSIEGQIEIDLTQIYGIAEHLKLLYPGEEYAKTTRISLKQQARYGTDFSHNYDGLKSLDIKRFNYTSASDPFRCHSFEKFRTLAELNLINLSIVKIPDDVFYLENVTKMDLSGNDFVYLPTTMRRLDKLKCLRLCNCPKLVSLPQLTQVETLIVSDCGNLQSVLKLRAKEEENTYCLLELWLDNCRNVTNLSYDLYHLTKLTYLNLSRHDFMEVPSSIRKLSSLETLLLKNCKKIRTLKELPKSLRFLSVQGCDSLESITVIPGDSIRHLDHRHCPCLKLDEHLIDRFGHGQEVSRYSALSRNRVVSHFDDEPTRIIQPSIWASVSGNFFQFLTSFFGRRRY